MAKPAPTTPRRYWLDRVIVARAALARGPLVRTGKYYRCGRVRFSLVTVRKLIAAGEAAIDPRTRALVAVAPAPHTPEQ